MDYTMSTDEYNNFLRALTNLKEVCNDVDIREGVIRQRSNDKTSIFEIDLTPILPGVSIAISDIKKKLDLLKTFSGQDVTLHVEEGTGGNDGFFIFSDSFSSIRFMSPTLQYIDNKFMTSDELDRIFVMNEEDLILEYDISGMIAERIRVTTLSFNTDAIQIAFEGEAATIKAATQAKDQFAKFVTDVPTNVVLENCSVLISTIPFGIDYDTDVEFKMYKDQHQDISLNSFKSSLGELDVKILTRSSIVGDDD